MSEQIETLDSQDDAGEFQRWLLELKLAEKDTVEWVSRARKVVRRYRDDRDGLATDRKKFNILWSNIQTLFPAVYSRAPQAVVSRRYNDDDPVGRVASTILERSLNFEIEHFSDFDSAMRNSVQDRLLAGRGVSWARYEPTLEPMGQEAGEYGEDYDGEQTEELTDDVQVAERVVDEHSPIDYVFWEDFLVSPARTWEEVRWVARRVYLTKDEGMERFGDEFANVPLDHKPTDLNDKSTLDHVQSAFKKAEIYEIWCKTSGHVYWLSKSYKKLLDKKPDPLELEEFFPCPKPLSATMTTNSITPIPDFCQYQDQATELDELTERIYLLTKAVKVVGVYDAASTGVKRMLNEGVDNEMIPVDNWAMFAERGGIKGQVDWLPIDMIVNARTALEASRDAMVQQIYELTGMSDILRGASNPAETATAQRIKSTFGSLRLRSMQKEAAQFADSLIRIKAQIMCKFYQPETLVAMSGVALTDDAQLIPQALELLKDDPMRTFRVEVNADSMVEIDEQADQAARMEFLGAVGQYMTQAVTASQAIPEAAPLMAKMLMFAVRSFKVGREMEGSLEQTLNNLKPPAPQQNGEQMKMQMQMQLEQAKMQASRDKELAQLQADIQSNQSRAAADIEIEKAKMQATAQTKMLEHQHNAQLESLKAQAADMQAAQKMEFERYKADLDADTKLLVAKINAKTQLQLAGLTEMQAAEATDISIPEASSLHDALSALVQSVNASTENILMAHGAGQQALTQAISDAMTRPKQVIRDPATNKIIGVQ